MKVDLDELDKLSKDAMPAPWRDDTPTGEDDGEWWDKDTKLITAMRNNIDAMIEELKMYREAEFHAEQSAMYDRKHNDDGSGNES